MAKIAYKNIGIGKEGAALGSSAALSRYIHIKSLDLRPNENKVVLDDTSASFRGGLKYHRQRVTIEGSLEMYATPINMVEALELVCGASNGGAALGTSATTYAFTVNDATYMSKWIRCDDGNGIEDYHGLRAKTFTLDLSDTGSITLDLVGQGYTSVTGASMVDTVDTQLPFTLGEVKVYYGASVNLLGGVSAVEISAHDIKIEYDNGLEGTHQSGRREIARSDAKIPTAKLMFKRFYDNTMLRDNALQTSTFYAMRVEGTLLEPTIVGTTPFYFKIDFPKIEVVEKPERNYQAGEMIFEDITMQAVVDSPTGALWQPTVNVGK